MMYVLPVSKGIFIQMAKDFIGIGIIGAGFARTTQIPGFQACPGARVVTIASARRENAVRAAQECGIPRVADDWKAVIADEEVDLVSIVTPPFTHCEMAIRALEAGKHVLCEKPMAMNAKEADKMRQEARMSGRMALLDHELRFLPGRLKAREIVRRGDLGIVRHVKLTFRYDTRANSTLAWDWWSDERAGGGVLAALGSHAIDGFRWLLGADPVQVFANLTTHVRERPDPNRRKRFVTSDDECNMLLRFKDSELTHSTTGAMSLSMVEAGKPEHRLEIYGAQGALMLEGNGELWQADVGEKSWRRIYMELGEIAPGITHESGWARGFTAFSRQHVAALLEGNTKVNGAATFDDGYYTQIILDAARTSHEQGRWIIARQ